MSDPRTPDLTHNELTVLKVLWSQGQLSAREIHQRLAESVDWAYTTTRTVLDRMAAKGLVSKRSLHGIYVFAARVSRPRGLAGIVRELADQVLGLEYAPVVSLFADAHGLSEEEVAELSRLLEEDDE